MQSSWQNLIGLGVAGNFAGHLEQAGEAGEFMRLGIAKRSSLHRQQVV